MRAVETVRRELAESTAPALADALIRQLDPVNAEAVPVHETAERLGTGTAALILPFRGSQLGTGQCQGAYHFVLTEKFRQQDRPQRRVGRIDDIRRKAGTVKLLEAAVDGHGFEILVREIRGGPGAQEDGAGFGDLLFYLFRTR